MYSQLVWTAPNAPLFSAIPACERGLCFHRIENATLSFWERRERPKGVAKVRACPSVNRLFPLFGKAIVPLAEVRPEGLFPEPEKESSMSMRFGNVSAMVGLMMSLVMGATGGCGTPAEMDEGNTDQAQQESKGATQLWDDFRNGFSASQPTDKWGYFQFGPAFTGNDGIETVSNRGLHVVAKGVNPVTGQPAFTSTVVPETDSRSVGLPGGVDHVKWLVYANHLSSHGYPGFDATEQREIGCEAWMGGSTIGVQNHPFGSAVQNPQDDLRLAAFALNAIDLETFMVFDTFMTSEGIYAFYERLPFGRGPQLGNYMAFSFAKRVADNHPGEMHKIAISYDKSHNRARWYVDGQVVQTVENLGLPIDRSNMILDHGGTPTQVSPNQLNCGMGLFTLLDAGKQQGLVKLSTESGFYYKPPVGEPTVQTFVDEQGLDGSRLFGQGAEVFVKKYNIISRPSH